MEKLLRWKKRRTMPTDADIMNVINQLGDGKVVFADYVTTHTFGKKSNAVQHYHPEELHLLQPLASVPLQSTSTS